MRSTLLAIHLAMTACTGVSEPDTDPDTEDDLVDPNTDGTEADTEPDTEPELHFTFPEMDCSAPVYAPPPSDTDPSDDTIACDSPSRAPGSNCKMSSGLCVSSSVAVVSDPFPSVTKETKARRLVTATDESRAYSADVNSRLLVVAFLGERFDPVDAYAFDLCTQQYVGSLLTPLHDAVDPDDDPPRCPLGVWRGPEELAPEVLAGLEFVDQYRHTCLGDEDSPVEPSCACNFNHWLPELPDVCLTP